MILGCFPASDTGYPESVQGTMKAEAYQVILERNILVSVREHCLSPRPNLEVMEPVYLHRKCLGPIQSVHLSILEALRVQYIITKSYKICFH